MIKIEILCGIPGSGKSTYARELMKREPGVWKRLNNDDFRLSIDLGEYSPANEKIIRNTRKYLLEQFLAEGYSVLMDNVNIGKRNWEEITKIAEASNRDVQCYEKIFYVELEEAILRDSKREGKACVGKEVVEKWWKESGKTQFKFRVPRVEIFNKRNAAVDRFVKPMVQDESLPRAIICDLDGTLARIGDRSPYDASRCHLVDSCNDYVAETVRLYYQAGYKIIFCSGRMEKDREPSRLFIEKHLPNMEYVLFLRKNDDLRKDHVIKEEIFNEHIRNKYWTRLALDDRKSVCQLWFRLGLSLLRAGDPEANF